MSFLWLWTQSLGQSSVVWTAVTNVNSGVALSNIFFNGMHFKWEENSLLLNFQKTQFLSKLPWRCLKKKKDILQQTSQATRSYQLVFPTHSYQMLLLTASCVTPSYLLQQIFAAYFICNLLIDKVSHHKSQL